MLNILLESEMLDEFMPIFLGNPEILFEESQHQFFFHQDAFSLVLFFYLGQGPDTKSSSNYVWPAHQRVLGLVLSLTFMLWVCLLNSWQVQTCNNGSCSNLCRLIVYDLFPER